MDPTHDLDLDIEKWLRCSPRPRLRQRRHSRARERIGQTSANVRCVGFFVVCIRGGRRRRQSLPGSSAPRLGTPGRLPRRRVAVVSAPEQPGQLVPPPQYVKLGTRAADLVQIWSNEGGRCAEPSPKLIRGVRYACHGFRTRAVLVLLKCAPMFAGHRANSGRHRPRLAKFWPSSAVLGSQAVGARRSRTKFGQHVLQIRPKRDKCLSGSMKRGPSSTEIVVVALEKSTCCRWRGPRQALKKYMTLLDERFGRTLVRILWMRADVLPSRAQICRTRQELARCEVGRGPVELGPSSLEPGRI